MGNFILVAELVVLGSEQMSNNYLAKKEGRKTTCLLFGVFLVQSTNASLFDMLALYLQSGKASPLFLVIFCFFLPIVAIKCQCSCAKYIIISTNGPVVLDAGTIMWLNFMESPILSLNTS